MTIGNLQKDYIPAVYKPLFWLWFIIPVIVLAAVAYIYRRQLKSAADIVGTRMRKAGKVAAKRLKKAAACMKTGNREKFYDEMLIALWGYVGAKLNIPTSELNRQNVAERLIESGATQDLVDEFVDVLDQCEYAKYAPGSGSDELKSVYDRGAEIIGKMEDARLKHVENPN